MNYSHFIAIFLMILVAAIVVGGTWMKVNKRKKEKRLLRRQFEDFAIRNNLAIDKNQIVRKNMIGIDRLNFKLVFLDTGRSINKFQVIDMKNIRSCRVDKQTNKGTGHTSKISLQCMLINSADINLVFFDENKDDLFKIMRSFKKASYWKKCIDIFTESANLSNKKNQKISHIISNQSYRDT